MAFDPLSTTLAAAIAAGATAALKETAAKAVKDAYEAIKSYIAKMYSQIDVNQIERNPEAATRQSVLQDEIVSAGAQDDQELKDLAGHLLDAVEEHDESVGLKAKVLRVKLLEIDQVVEGAGAKADVAEIETIRMGTVGKKKK
jgi:hypothetical protein